MEGKRDILAETENRIDALLMGKACTKLDDAGLSERDALFAKKFNLLADHLNESSRFAKDIATGSLDVDLPGRRNYLAAPLKEIHSQLISFCYSIGQLMAGKMVSKLHYPGELFETYNALIDQVSRVFGSTQDEREAQWGEGSVTSWRYHQILSAINQLRILILEVNPAGEIVFANPPARDALLNLDRLPYDVIKKSDRPYQKNDALIRYLCTFADRSAELLPSNLLSSGFPVLHELFDQESGSWYKITTDRITLADGAYGLLHMIDDISEWKKQEHQLTLSATIDPLTGAYTRKAGFQKLTELIQTRHERTNCVAFVDIDGLKSINDQHGHTEGDFAIKTIAENLLNCVRRSDWVVRYGGDEFLVLFLDCEKPVAQSVIDRMYLRIETANQQINKPYKLAFSVGLSVVTEDMKDVSDLVAVVDQYMYQNKLKRKKERNLAAPS